MYAEPQEQSLNQSESFTDLPIALKECIEALEDFDLLSPAPFGPSGTRLDSAVRAQPLLPPPAKALADYTMKRYNDLEQIIEEDSIQPDASELVEVRSNDFHVQISRCGSQTMPSFTINIDENPDMILKTMSTNQDDIRSSCQFSRAQCNTSESPLKKMIRSNSDKGKKRLIQENEFDTENTKNMINDPTAIINRPSSRGEALLSSIHYKSNLRIIEPSITSKSNDSQNKNLFTKMKHIMEPPKLSKNFNAIFKKKKNPAIQVKAKQPKARKQLKSDTPGIQIIKANKFSAFKFKSPKASKDLKSLEQQSTTLQKSSAITQQTSLTSLTPRGVLESYNKTHRRSNFNLNFPKSQFQIYSKEHLGKSSKELYGKENIKVLDCGETMGHSVFDQSPSYQGHSLFKIQVMNVQGHLPNHSNGNQSNTHRATE